MDVAPLIGWISGWDEVQGTLIRCKKKRTAYQRKVATKVATSSPHLAYACVLNIGNVQHELGVKRVFVVALNAIVRHRRSKTADEQGFSGFRPSFVSSHLYKYT